MFAQLLLKKMLLLRDESPFVRILRRGDKARTSDGGIKIPRLLPVIELAINCILRIY